MGHDTRLTVIMPFFNEEKWLPVTLKSLEENFADIDELILSDNGSTDRSLALVQEAFDGREHVTILESALPNGDARNNYEHIRLLSRMSETPYTLLFRAKDFVSHGYVATMKKAFEKYPDAVGFYPVVEMYWEEYTSTEDCFAVWKPEKFNYKTPLRQRLHEAYTDVYADHIFWSPMQTELLQEFFDRTENYESASDIFLPFRLALQGALVFVPEATWYRRYRRETPLQEIQRLAERGKFVTQKVNPAWYIPWGFWHIGKLYAPQIFTEGTKKRFDMYMRILRDAYWSDEEWVMRHTYETAFAYLHSLVAGRPLILFGTGKDAEKLYQSLTGRMEIQEAWDNFKEGKEFHEIPIRKPERKNEVFVLIASSDYQLKLMDQLESMGYIYEKDFISCGELRGLMNCKESD